MIRSESKQKRLLIFFHDLGVGGIQRRLVDIIEYLQAGAEKPVDVTLYIKSYSGNRHNRDYIERIEKSGARIIYRPRWTMGPFRIGTFTHMLWTVIRVNPDVILTSLRLLSIGAVIMKKMLWWKSMKVVLNEGIVTSELLKDEIPKWSRIIWHQMMRWAYPRADRVIVPTTAVKRDLIDSFHVPAEKIVLGKHWTVTNDNHQKARSSKRIVYNLIFVGRVEPQKNLGRLLQLVKALQKKHPTLRVCIVGTGSLRKSLQKKANDLKIDHNIDFVGRKENVLPYLRKSQIFILTSHYEGMPVSVLEAKAAGIPAVISNYPGAKEVVEDGRDGYIFNTPREAVERISALVSDQSLREEIGKNAQMRAKKEFGLSALAHFCSQVTLV